MATIINIPIAVIIGFLISRNKIPGTIFLDIAVSLPMAVPPVVIGFLLLLLLGRDGPIGKILYDLFEADIVFTWIAAVIASSIVSFPLVARAAITAIGEIDEKLEHAARTLGASQIRVLLTITIPLAYRGILAGTLLGFVRAMSEFGATIIVAGNIPGKTQTIPLAIYTSVQIRDDTNAIMLTIFSITLAILTLLVHNMNEQNTVIQIIDRIKLLYINKVTNQYSYLVGWRDIIISRIIIV